MAQNRAAWTCRDCGYRSAKWLGRCPECGAWASLDEGPHNAPARTAAQDAAARVVPFVALEAAEAARSSTRVDEFDRVLGGGLVAGAVILVGGEPGIGKSTLLLQAAAAMAADGAPVLYVSAEESAAQLRLRGERIGVSAPHLLVFAETDVDAAVDAARTSRAAVVVVDSIQAVRCADVDSVPGSVGQVREAAARFIALAKTTGVPVVLVGHVTKDGSIAGPRALEHAVDTVLQFEGDRLHAYRILRALKNRYGPADEVGVFAMSDTGLRGVASPSELFLAERPGDAPGSAVVAAVEGTRALMLEVQALVGEPIQGSPRRTALGVDPGRLALILAVLERRAGLDLGARDVFVNVPGGLLVDEPAADLAIALATASSHGGRPLAAGTAVIGELGLTGELRSVSRMEARLREARRMRFVAALVPPAPLGGSPPDGLTVVPVPDLPAALAVAFSRGRA